MHQMRAVTLSNYLEVATFAGLDGRRMLRQAGISLEALQHPETRIPASAVVRLLERSAAESGCESFGLLVAERRTFARDRKSTRLNSSHVKISYAVFCLTKKNITACSS